MRSHSCEPGHPARSCALLQTRGRRTARESAGSSGSWFRAPAHSPEVGARHLLRDAPPSLQRLPAHHRPALAVAHHDHELARGHVVHHLQCTARPGGNIFAWIRLHGQFADGGTVDAARGEAGDRGQTTGSIVGSSACRHVAERSNSRQGPDLSERHHVGMARRSDALHH